MKRRTLIKLAGVAAVGAALVLSAGTALLCLAFGLIGAVLDGRPEWDQAKAVELVEKVLAVEQAGQPWDDIAWLTDVDEAVARAWAEDKPLFVYAFVKGTRGPAAAPC